MSVQFYIKSKVLSFRVTVFLVFSFLLQETLISGFPPPYDSLKLNLDTNYLMKSEDTVLDAMQSVHFFSNSKVFLFRVGVQLLHFNFGDEIVRITDR